MNNEALIATLDDLIQTCNDGEEGFRACAEERIEQHFRVPLLDRAIDCATASRTLQALVREYDSEPDIDDAISASLRRRWTNIQQAVLHKSGREILDECERGEDIALLSYRNALGKALPAPIRAIVEVQYEGVLRNHALMRLLRDEIPLA